nr:helix-turn-helix domain-containing protein [uncultured Pedobacter sp.]
MHNKPRAFVKKPIFLKLKTNKLNYLDILTYTAIKSFDNPKGGCFPSNEKIASRSGLSRTFVIESIKRLEKSNYLKIYKNGNFKSPNRSFPNQYSFKPVHLFNPVPYNIFEVTDLTVYQKAMLLLLRQFAVTDFEIDGTINKFADRLELTYNTIKKQFDSLILKGYLKPIDKRLTELKIIDWSYPEHRIGNIIQPISHKPEIDINNFSFIMT